MDLFNFFKTEEHERLLEESANLYKDLEAQYLKLRKEHWELLEKDTEDIIDNLVLHNQKLKNELAEARELLTQYHIVFGDEILEKMERKVFKKNNKKSETEEVEM